VKFSSFVAVILDQIERSLPEGDPEVEIEWVSCGGHYNCGSPKAGVANVVFSEGKMVIEASETL
jgi:hypothetical protein